MNDGIISKSSKYSVEETLHRLETILTSKGIKIFALIDHSGEAEKAGLKMPPTQLLIFGNPKGGTPAMLAAPTAAIDLPLKALAWQDANGQVWLSYNDPEYIANRFGLSADVMKPLAGMGALIEQALAAVSIPAQPALPSSFVAKTIHSPEGADIFVRFGGNGPVVLLLHGYAENSDSWAPLSADLMKDHTVVVPDLRGIGRSSKPASGYDKKTQAKDIRAVVTSLGFDKTFVVAHDIGNMVAYAYAATYPDKVERLVVMDAPIPGIEPWSEILQNPGVWHFNFRGPDAERLVAGRERIYFDRIWNDFTGDPGQPDEATRNFFAATYAQSGGMRAGFAQFAAFSQDAQDNKVFEQTKLTMPVMAVGGEKSFGSLQAVIMRHVATNVQEEVVAGSGHWLMEERPAYTVALIRKFLDAPSGPANR
jgi:pimeloyl-ACP methyl ester carboxylesterase/uncharacterized protein (DUF302 family)